jgi:hypothetical protein
VFSTSEGREALVFGAHQSLMCWTHEEMIEAAGRDLQKGSYTDGGSRGVGTVSEIHREMV